MIDFVVWGGLPEAEEADHWGTFDTLEEAEAYVRQQVALQPRLVLCITETIRRTFD